MASYTLGEKQIIREHYATIADPQDMEKLLPGRKMKNIASMANKMGIVREKPCRPNAWTTEEEELIWSHYGTMSKDEIARKHFPHRSAEAVKVHINRMMQVEVVEHFALTKAEKRELSQRFHDLFVPEIQISESIVLR